MPLLKSFALFLPLFLCLELVSAAPGRADVREILRHGLRNFGRHLVLLLGGIALFHFGTRWFLERAPLW